MRFLRHPRFPSIEPELRPAFQPARKLVPAINWEQFMGVKLLAWIGGLAAFLAVAFFVKYSFDNNLISPEVRMAIGFIAGLGLLVGGVVMSRKEYAVLAHTLVRHRRGDSLRGHICLPRRFTISSSSG